MRSYFRQRSVLNEMYFVVSINVIFQPYKSFEPPSSPVGEGDRHMPSGTFLDKIQCRTTFMAVLSSKWNGFCISINLIFQPYKSFKPPSSTPRGEDRHAFADFFGQNSMPNNFYLKVFLPAMCIFGSVINVIFQPWPTCYI